jgi:hypothetical protein
VVRSESGLVAGLPLAVAGDSVWTFDAESGQGRKAIQFPDGFHLLFRAVWTPDGKSIIVNRSETTSHIVLLENLQ